MTDSEIIKALEYCKDCSANLNVEIIDLITRQQAEIEELRKGFTADADYFASEYDKNIKSEAYKEFAEKVKEFMHNKFKALDEYEFEYITEGDIDSLVKEIIGE